MRARGDVRVARTSRWSSTSALVRRYAVDGDWAPRNPMLVMLLGVVVGPPGDDEELAGRGEGLLAARGTPGAGRCCRRAWACGR